jgi:hypothetical protein
MQDNLSAQVSQMLATLTQSDAPRLQSGANSPTSAEFASLSPAERLERLQALQAQSDQLLMRLDTTLRVVFEALQRNLQSYQDSLGEGLGRMHNMGQQGEAVFAAFVTRLAQLLGRETSSFLQPPQNWDDEQQLYGDARTLPGQATENLSRETDPDRQISRLLEELNALDPSRLNPDRGESLPFDPNDPASPLAPPTELEPLEDLDREIRQLDLSVLPEPLDGEAEPMNSEPNDRSPFPPFVEGELMGQPPSAENASENHEHSIDEFASALDLLNQVPATDPSFNEAGEQEADFQPTRSGFDRPSIHSTQEPEPVSSPDELYSEQFYQNLSRSTANSSADQIPQSPSIPSGGRQEPLGVDDASLDDASLLAADLFAGLVDPAEETLDVNEPPLFESLPTTDFPQVPQSVESLLLQQPPHQPAQEDLTLDQFFNEEIPDPLEGMDRAGGDAQIDRVDETDTADPISAYSEDSEEAVETIAALTDLIPETELNLLLQENQQAFSSRFNTEPLQPLTQDLSQRAATPLERSGGDSGEEMGNWTLADWIDTDAVNPTAPAPQLPNLEPPTAKTPFGTQTFYASDWTVSPVNAPQSALEEAIEDLFSPDLPNATSPSQPQMGNDVLDATIENWFTNLEAVPTVSPAEKQVRQENQGSLERESALFEWDVSSDEDNTFTLEGLDSLFENVAPSAPPPRQPSETDTQRITLDDAFGDFSEPPSPPLKTNQKTNQAHSASPPVDAEVEKKKFSTRPDSTH